MRWNVLVKKVCFCLLVQWCFYFLNAAQVSKSILDTFIAFFHMWAQVNFKKSMLWLWVQHNHWPLGGSSVQRCVWMCLMASLKGWEEALPWSRQSHQGLFCMQRLCLRACGWNTQTTTTVSVCSVPTAGEKTQCDRLQERERATQCQRYQKAVKIHPHTLHPQQEWQLKKNFLFFHRVLAVLFASAFTGVMAHRGFNFDSPVFRPQNRWISSMARFQVPVSYINLYLYSYMM